MNALKLSAFALLLSTFSVAHAGAAQAKPLVCANTEAGLTDENVEAIRLAIDQRITAALGPKQETSTKRGPGTAKADPKAMYEIAQLAGCAAVIDVDSSCAIYFDPEFSTSLGVLTDLPKKTPLRQQFDNALKSLPEGVQKKAALACMKRVAAK